MTTSATDPSPCLALDVATGAVIAEFKPRYRHQEFLSFLRRIDKEVPKDLELHLTVDNYCTHKHAKVRTWLAHRLRFHVHYTPTYASWLLTQSSGGHTTWSAGLV